MKLLALDTSTDACSAALLVDGEIQWRFEVAPQRHTELLLPMIDALMAEAQLRPQQLDCLAFGRGPGSFTGIRIATGVIQGIALGADLPVTPVSTLAALAQGVAPVDNLTGVICALDARISEIYLGSYRWQAHGLVTLTGEETVCSPVLAIVPQAGIWHGAGSGWGLYHKELLDKLGTRLPSHDAKCYPQAKDIAVLGAQAFQHGQGVTAENALPVYLRDQVTHHKNA